MEKIDIIIDLRNITDWNKLNKLRLLLVSPIEEVQERYHITGNNPVILKGKHIPEVIIFPGYYMIIASPNDLNASLILNKKQQTKIINQAFRLLKAEMAEMDIKEILNYLVEDK
jgi:hypothetical protein